MVVKSGGFPKVNAADIAKRFGQQARENVTSWKDKTKFWNCPKDKSNNGYAVIRFLPDRDPAALPYIEVKTWSWEVNGTKFFGIDRETFGEVDPAQEWIDKQDPKLIEKFGMKAKTRWISNILVVEDSVTENVGKIKLLDYGFQVFKILKSKVKPVIETRAPLYYWDYETGANMELVLGKDERNGRPSWEQSQFLRPEDIAVTLKNLRISMDDVTEGLFDLKTIVKEMTCPTYEERKEQIEKFLKRAGLDDGGAFGGTKYDKGDADRVNAAKEKAKETDTDDLPGEKTVKPVEGAEVVKNEGGKTSVTARIKKNLANGSFADQL
jgi:hypothetical protein